MIYKLMPVPLEELPIVNDAATFSCSVYVIQEGDDGPVKVGIAGHPRRRLATLQTGNPRPLHLRGVWRGKRDHCLEIERATLLCLRDEGHKISGEWVSTPLDLVMTLVNDCEVKRGAD